MQNNNTKRYVPKDGVVKKTFENDSRRNNFRRPGFEKPTHNYVQTMIYIRTTAITRTGGVIRRKSVLLLMSDPVKHKIGIGSGKAHQVQDAIKQAEKDAINNMVNIRVLRLANGTVTVPQKYVCHHNGIKFIITPKYRASQLKISPLIAKLFNAIGINAGGVKIIGKSAAKQNQVSGCIQALQSIESARDVALRLSKEIPEIIEKQSIFHTIRSK